MASHALVDCNYGGFVTDWWPGSFVLTRAAMQMAPVVFIALFGSMLEIAYLPRFRKGEGALATRRLLGRALQCYVLYVISVLALWVEGKYTLGYTIRCILMAGVTPYTDILKFYAVALALAPLVIRLRERVGLRGLMVITLLVPICYPLLGMLPPLPEIGGRNYLRPIMGFLMGWKSEVGAPSVLHGMALVMFGMILGRAVLDLFDKTPGMIREGVRWLLVYFILRVGILLWFWNWETPWKTVSGLANMSIRNTNHPLYYSAGIATTVLAVSLCVFVFDFLQQRWADGLKFLGRTSLFTFCFGNVMLYWVTFHPVGAVQGHAVWLGLVAVIALMAWLFDAAMRSTPWTQRSAPVRTLTNGVRDLTKWAQARIDRAVRPLAARYAAGLKLPPEPANEAKPALA